MIIDENEKLPLSPNTKSGALIEEIEKPFRESISFYKTNVVKCLPLYENKIRYPLKHEMEKCYPNLEDEINILKPSIVFLLGKQVSDFVLNKKNVNSYQLNENFVYNAFRINNRLFVPIHHPSFILVYRRKLINKYIEGVSELFSEVVVPECEFA